MKSKTKYRKPNLVKKRNILALVISIIICIFFMAEYLEAPIVKSNCQTISAEFKSYEIVLGRTMYPKGLHIYYTNSEYYYIDHYNVSDTLTELIKALDKDTELTFTVYKDYNEIVELSAEDDVLFSYSDYLEGFEKSKKPKLIAFLITMIIPVINIVEIYKQKTRYNKSKKPRS